MVASALHLAEGSPAGLYTDGWRGRCEPVKLSPVGQHRRCKMVSRFVAAFLIESF